MLQELKLTLFPLIPFVSMRAKDIECRSAARKERRWVSITIGKRVFLRALLILDEETVLLLVTNLEFLRS
jgi:hypothetical protein